MLGARSLLRRIARVTRPGRRWRDAVVIVRRPPAQVPEGLVGHLVPRVVSLQRPRYGAAGGIQPVLQQRGLQNR